MVRFDPIPSSYRDLILGRAAKASGIERLQLEMDLAAANATCPLDWEKLVGFDEFNFFHDIMGIQANIDRETGELHCFLPRCARRQ